jgi:hypothetical protein
MLYLRASIWEALLFLSHSAIKRLAESTHALKIFPCMDVLVNTKFKEANIQFVHEAATFQKSGLIFLRY